MTYDEKVKHLKELYSQQLELSSNIKTLQNELAHEGYSVRQTFVNKVNFLVNMLQDLNGYEVVFYYEEKASFSYSSKTAVCRLEITRTDRSYGHNFYWNSSFTRKNPTTEKIVKTKFKQLEKLLEQYVQREPEFKYQYEKRKLAQTLKEI